MTKLIKSLVASENLPGKGTGSRIADAKCWGPTIPVVPSDFSCSRMEWYEEAGLWRQSSCQVVQEDPMRPLREAISELVPDWDSKLPDMGPITTMLAAQKAAEDCVGATCLGALASQVACGETADSILIKTAKDLVAIGYLGAEVLQWAQAQAEYSLVTSFEPLPTTILPIGFRGERPASITGLVHRTGLRRVAVPRKVLEARDGLHGRQYEVVKEEVTHTEKDVTMQSMERVAGRMIWDPWPFLVLHTEQQFDELLARAPGKVVLQEVSCRVNPDGSELLVPRPLHQKRIVATKLIHRGTVPLEILGGVPTRERMAAHHRQVSNTPFQEVWSNLLDAMAKPYQLDRKPRFWVPLL